MIKRFKEPTADKISKIISLFEEQEYSRVVTHCNNLLGRFPDSANIYNLMGGAYAKLGNRKRAIKCFKRLKNINPQNVEAIFNIALMYQELGENEQAIAYYEKVIEANAKFIDAYINLNSILFSQEEYNKSVLLLTKAINQVPTRAALKFNLANSYARLNILEKALELYLETLNLNPQHHKALKNASRILFLTGDFENAFSTVVKAIELDPLVTEYWDELSYQSLVHNKDIKKYEFIFNTNDTDKTGYIDVNRSILEYQKAISEPEAVQAIALAKEKLNNLADKKIQNNTVQINKKSTQTETKNLTALLHFGRSGTGLLHSLIDGHPEISSLPSIFLSEYFDPTNWSQLTSEGLQNLSARFISKYDVLFNSNSAVPILTRQGFTKFKFGESEGLTNLGPNRNLAININKTEFKEYLDRLIYAEHELDAFKFFLLVNKAYTFCLNKDNRSSLIFYHIHNPSDRALINFSSLATDSSFIVMVREPIQSCESWIKNDFKMGSYDNITMKILGMLNLPSSPLFAIHKSVGVQLEKLKLEPHKTLRSLCDWLEVTDSKTLYDMTANGLRWWGDPTSIDYINDGANPFGTTAINRSIGSVFSVRDSHIFNLLFYPFKYAYGYVAHNEKFLSQLSEVDAELDNLFGFEEKMIAAQGIDIHHFKKSGPYQRFRIGLRNKLKILRRELDHTVRLKPL